MALQSEHCRGLRNNEGLTHYLFRGRRTVIINYNILRNLDFIWLSYMIFTMWPFKQVCCSWTSLYYIDVWMFAFGMQHSDSMHAEITDQIVVMKLWECLVGTPNPQGSSRVSSPKQWQLSNLRWHCNACQVQLVNYKYLLNNYRNNEAH